MRLTHPAWLLASVFLFAPVGHSQVAPDPLPASACAPSGDGCTRAALQATMDKATTVNAQAPSHDRFAQGQLNQLVKKLGKQVAPPNHAADVTWMLTAPEPTGVDVGPGARELATLRVFSGQTGKLVWVERLTGTGDRPWPALVEQLLNQFKATLAQGS